MRYAHEVDILQEHLSRARASGGVFARSAALPPWGIVMPGTIQLALHTVLRGSARLWLENPAESIELVPGDLVLVRGGPDHHIASGADPALCVEHEEFWRRQAADQTSPDGDATVFMCGAYRFAGDVGSGLIEALPSLLMLRPAADDALHDAIAMLSRELTTPAPGQQTVLDRLLDVLLVLAIRAAYAQTPSAPRWYQASADGRLNRALHAMHSDPGHPWTVAELAALSSMSRPSFARNFDRALGQSPMQYLTQWRLTLARDYLRAGELTIPQIARQTGYSSPNAFAAAFKRHLGHAPGQWKHSEHAHDSTLDDGRQLA